MKTSKYDKLIAERGDKIRCKGIVVTIDRIHYQDFWEHWDIEFEDTYGHYRHWKQCFEGGELIPKKEGKYRNTQGVDCTDIFKKYGYC